MSTWTTPGWSAFRRSAILSRAPVPVIVNRPCESSALLVLTCDALAAVTAAALPGSATIPAAPAATVAASAADASRTARDSLSRVGFFICARLLSSEPRTAQAVSLSLVMVAAADARSHRGDPPDFATVLATQPLVHDPSYAWSFRTVASAVTFLRFGSSVETMKVAAATEPLLERNAELARIESALAEARSGARQVRGDRGAGRDR